MKKLSIEQFREIKNKMTLLIKEANEKDLSLEEEELLLNKYLELQNELTSYDLSDIPFSEWQDFTILTTDEIKADFSRTHANIDFSIVSCYGNTDFRGCNIRNLEELDSRHLLSNTYDDKTLEEYKSYLLTDSFSQEFREKYFSHTLLIEDLASLTIEQLDLLKDRNIYLHLDYSEKNNYLLSAIDLDTAINYCRTNKEEYQAVRNILSGSNYYKFTFPSEVYQDFTELVDTLKNSEITEFKNICFTFLRNQIIKRGNMQAIEEYPELFVNENKKLFLIDVDVSDEIKRRYFSHELTITDLIDNQEVFKSIPIDNFLRKSYTLYTTFFSKYDNGEFQKLVFQHPDFFKSLTENNNLDNFFNCFDNQEESLSPHNRLIKAVRAYYLPTFREDKQIPDFLSSFNFQLVDEVKDRETLMSCSDNAIILDEFQNTVFEVLGIEFVKKYEEENNFFFHDFGNYYYSNFFDYLNRDYIDYKSIFNKLNPATTYEECLSNIASALDVIRTRHIADQTTYDWVQGDLRKKHPEIFMSEESPEKLKELFYNNSLNIHIIKEHPEYIPFLLDKNLSTCLNLEMYLDTKVPLGENDNVLKSFGLTSKSEQFDFILEYTKRYGNESFLKLVSEYGNYLEYLHIESENDEISDKEMIEKALRKSIAEKIQLENTDYRHLRNVIEFYEEYKEAFIDLSNINLDESVKKEIEDAFYKGKMTFEYFKKYPELKKTFDNTYLYLGFRNSNNFLSDTSISQSISSKGPSGGRRKRHNRIRILKEDDSPVFKSNFRLTDEFMIELAIKYGQNLDYVISVINMFAYENSDYLTLESVDSFVEEVIINKMTLGEIKYNEESIPPYFKTKYHELFLSDDVDTSLKDKFYNKEMDVKDILNNLYYYLDIFKETSITAGLSKDYNWISTLFKSDSNANLYRLKVLAQFESIKDDLDLAYEFKNYLLENEDEINKNNIEVLGNILRRLSNTNSTSLHSVRKTLTRQLLQLDNPMESYERIEKIFLRNNLPLYGKMFYCFEILYPDFTKGSIFDFSDESRLSPELKDETLAKVKRYDGNNTSTDKRFQIIYNDLVRIAVKSNSLDLRKYLDSIDQGQDLYYQILDSNKKLDDLNEEEIETLNILEMHLEIIYASSKKGKEDNLYLDEYDLLTKLDILVNKIGPTKRHDLKSRIVRMFAYSAGYRSYEELRDEMSNYVKTAHERGLRYAKELERRQFTLEDGDFLRCIGDYTSLGGSLDNGNLSKEFLSTIRGTSDSDTTPLDIDWTLIIDRGDIYHSVENTPTGFGFGNIYLVMKKDNPSIYITRDKEGNITPQEYDPMKTEMFGTKVGESGYETHWGSRTGIALTDIDFILYKKQRDINNYMPYKEDGSVNYVEGFGEYDDLGAIKFEIARHGFFIPIIDFAGQSLFSVEEYEELRKQIKGLSYYEEEDYTLSNNLSIPSIELDSVYPSVAEIEKEIKQSEEDTTRKREIIIELLKGVFDKYSLDIKREMNGDLTPGSIEVIDTGSTGRSTNEIGEGDFDLLLRLDSNIYEDREKLSEFQREIEQVLSKFEIADKTKTDRGDIRYKGVNLGNGIIVDLDISYDRKTDKIAYTTDECIRDRLKTIKKQYPEKYNQVLANIIIAKRVLKASGCYKSRNSAKPEGGLGGVGVENWILEHGGSFIDAARSFVDASNDKTYEEFRSSYSVWDFGENQMAERKGHYLHDNFITDNMNEAGYERMKKVLNEYLKKYDMSMMFDEIPSKDPIYEIKAI